MLAASLVNAKSRSLRTVRLVQLTANTRDGRAPVAPRIVLADSNHAVGYARIDVGGHVPVCVFSRRCSRRAVAGVGENRLAEHAGDAGPGHRVGRADTRVVGVGAATRGVAEGE